MKKVWKVIKGLITIFLILILLVVILQKVSNNKLTIGGFHIFSIASESMIPDYQIGDVIVSKKVDPGTLKVGDDVTYLGEKGDLKGLIITHRIIASREANGHTYVTTKGLANEVQDPEISTDSIYGKVIYKTFLFSFIGRLMKNIIMYYVLFIGVGVVICYEVITAFFLKKDDEDD